MVSDIAIVITLHYLLFIYCQFCTERTSAILEVIPINFIRQFRTGYRICNSTLNGFSDTVVGGYLASRYRWGGDYGKFAGMQGAHPPFLFLQYTGAKTIVKMYYTRRESKYCKLFFEMS